MNKFVLTDKNNGILGYVNGVCKFGFFNPHNIFYFNSEAEALSFRIKANFTNTIVLSETNPIVPNYDYPSQEIVDFLSSLQL